MELTTILLVFFFFLLHSIALYINDQFKFIPIVSLEE